MNSNYIPIGELVERVDERNTDGNITTLVGLSIDKCFIKSVANTVGTDLTKYKLIKKQQFAVSLMQVSRDAKIPVAMQSEYDVAIMSPAYPIFKVKDEKVILPEYLDMWFKRSEFDREAAFIAVGGVRGSMPWEEFCGMKVLVPTIEKQHKVVNAYKTITNRIALKQRLNDNLDAIAYAIYKETFITLSNEKWNKGTLSNLLTVKYGKDHKHLLNGSIPLYGSGGIMRYVEKSLYDKVSVLIPRKGTLSNVIYVDEPFWSVDTMFYTEIPKPYAAKFIYYFVKNKDLAGMDTGSAVPSMSSEIIHSMPLDIPDDETLINFDNRLKPLYAQMKANNQECAKLQNLQEILLATISSG
ncbi:MAG: restriction endonuclease subunit S [Firmicutes bacterium]|nr:restriction endonuclease subunit S [Bacillota bacterium]